MSTSSSPCSTIDPLAAEVNELTRLLAAERGRLAIACAALKQSEERCRCLQARIAGTGPPQSEGFASGIAHDLNNVLSPIRTVCDLLEMPMGEKDRRDLLELVRRSAQRGAQLVKRMLLASAKDERQAGIIPLEPVLEEIRYITRLTFPSSIRIQGTAQRDLWSVSVDATQLHRVLLNLCLNARDAMPGGGTLTVAGENVWVEGKRFVMLAVTDDGVGIPAEIQENIFEPFFTTKEPGKGTGLGLSTSLEIIRDHGGFIRVSSDAETGTVFRVYLPARQPAGALLQ